MVHRAAIEPDRRFERAADVERIGESTVFLFMRNDEVPVDGLSLARGTENQGGAHAVDIGIEKIRGLFPGLIDGQVFAAEIFGMHFAGIGGIDEGKARVMVVA